MRRSIAVAAAVAAPLASAGSLVAQGQAIVVNQCDYKMPIQNVPAVLPGIVSTVLPANAGHSNTYSQKWTQLSAGGWSIKIDPLNNPNALMQFEYTYNDAGQLFYDMSYVNADPSELQKLPTWQFICPTCELQPHHGAYHAWNDDAQGMQPACAPTDTVTLILCTEGSSGSSTPQTTAAPAPAPAPTTFKTTTTSDVSFKKANVNNNQAAAVTTTPSPAPAPTPAPTPAPAPAPAPAAAAPAESDVDVVTFYETKVVTAVVTETARARRKRHEHKHIHGHPQ